MAEKPDFEKLAKYVKEYNENSLKAYDDLYAYIQANEDKLGLTEYIRLVAVAKRMTLSMKAFVKYIHESTDYWME